MGLLSLTFAAALAASSTAPTTDSPYRETEAVSDVLLDTVRATALAGFARKVRLLNDLNAQLDFQQMAAGSRIAMDNWWAETGAALILINVIPLPVSP